MTTQSLTSFFTCDPEKPQQRFSIAGFYPEPASPRQVFNFGTGWRFFKGSFADAHKPEIEDSEWQLVCTPHAIEYLPEDASGTVAYLGEVWYRKHFDVPETFSDQKVFINFEAVQGKSKVWINGALVKINREGFTGFVIDVTEYLNVGGRNLIAVLADNSDDPTYPPGKPHAEVDSAYVGGIYRDVWLYTTPNLYITNSQAVDHVAGGGVYVYSQNVSQHSAEVMVKVHVNNTTQSDHNITVRSELLTMDGEQASSTNQLNFILAKTDQHIELQHSVTSPRLWHPDQPNLYWLKLEVRDQEDQVVDSIKIRIGIRSIEMRGAEGLYLNGEPFGEPLLGVNRHQFHAYVGMAMTNNMHYRDAQLIRNSGSRVVRTAHYPQDPAFMDACDELGILLLVPTIGWQFWHDSPEFAEQHIANIRNLIRRDRNHPSVMSYEPALNETYLPTEHTIRIYDVCHEEHPYTCPNVPADSYIEDHQYSDIIYAHPNQMKGGEQPDGRLIFDQFPDKSSFTREWGDNCDDWNAQNSSSRVHRSWGEQPQIVQANHYAVGSGSPEHMYTTNLDVLNKTPAQHVGGTLWHCFDHDRGYHPDQFWGGIMDAFRQPKYSYGMFCAQRDPKVDLYNAESGYHIEILHELTPFSGPDITIYANVDAVRATLFGKPLGTIAVKNDQPGIRFKPAVFKNVYDYMDLKTMHREDKHEDAYLLVEGLVNGEVVCQEKKYSSLRPTRLKLEVAPHSQALVADGSDTLTIIASVVDEQGTVKRLARNQIHFTVTGEAHLVGDSENFANPRAVEWGTAPVLIRATQKAAPIRVYARPAFEGPHSLLPAELTLTSVESGIPELAAEHTAHLINEQNDQAVSKLFQSEITQRLAQNDYLRLKLRGVEIQQTECGETEQ